MTLRWVLVGLLLAACGDDDASVDRRDASASDGGDRADARPPDDASTPTDATTGDASDSSDAATGDAGDGCPPDECCYELVYEQEGVFHTVVDGASQHTVMPLEAGEAFFCMRVEYTMQTVDNLVATTEAYEGCPIFSHLGGIQGTGAEGRVVGGAFFRMLRLGCAVRRPVAVQLDVWAPEGEERSTTLTGPWLPGQTYQIVQEVKPFTSSIELSQGGTVVGPRVESDISGTTVAMTRDPRVVFGLDKVYDGAFFPYFDAVYSDLRIYADVAPPP